MRAPVATVDRLEADPLTPTQQRIINAAHELFAEHGISGTSLQMIANSVGVSKAAVYHQFKTKEEIILAAASSELLTLQEVLDEAEAEPDRAKALDIVVTDIVDRAVKRRRRVALLHSDPVMIRLLADHGPFRAIMNRLYGLLTDGESEDARVRIALLASAIGTAVTHPLVVDMDNETLRSHILHFARRLLAVPRAKTPTPGRR